MKIFVDSSVLIEFENERRPELLDALLTFTHELYINSVVVSEFVYKLLGIIAGKSPMSVCESEQIKETLELHDTVEFLSNFSYLNIPKMAMLLSIGFMKTYNLLPNDALILATCKLENIAVLASYDSDFTKACRKEGIKLISKVEDL
jgi:uncharacterized protein